MSIPWDSMAPPKKDCCPKGHEYSPANSYHHPTKGGRVCRLCHRDQARESARRQAHARKLARLAFPMLPDSGAA